MPNTTKVKTSSKYPPQPYQQFWKSFFPNKFYSENHLRKLYRCTNYMGFNSIKFKENISLIDFYKSFSNMWSDFPWKFHSVFLVDWDFLFAWKLFFLLLLFMLFWFLQLWLYSSVWIQTNVQQLYIVENKTKMNLPSFYCQPFWRV